jgi:hypothetical protein
LQFFDCKIACATWRCQREKAFVSVQFLWICSKLNKNEKTDYGKNIFPQYTEINVSPRGKVRADSERVVKEFEEEEQK